MSNWPIHDGEPDYEPSDTELAGRGVNIEPTDPWDAPSYDQLNNPRSAE